MTTTTDKVTCRTAAYVAIFLVSLSTLHSASAWRNDRRKFSFDFIFIFFSRTCVSLLRLTFSSRCENPLVPLSWFIPPLPPTRLVPLGSRFTNYTIFFQYFLFCFCFFAQPKKKKQLSFLRAFPFINNSRTLWLYIFRLSVRLSGLCVYVLRRVCPAAAAAAGARKSLKMPRTIRECKFESTASCPSPFRLSSRDNFRPCGAYIPAVVNLLPALFQEKKDSSSNSGRRSSRRR